MQSTAWRAGTWSVGACHVAMGRARAVTFVVAAASLFALLAARRTAPRVAAHGEPSSTVEVTKSARPAASCRLFGSWDGAGALSKTAERLDDDEAASFNDHAVDVETLGIAKERVENLRVRATTSGGFAVEGWLPRRWLEVTTRRRVALGVEDAAWIPQGGRVELDFAEGANATVTPRSKTFDVHATVACDDLAIGPLSGAPGAIVQATEKTTNMGPRDEALHLSARPGGSPVFVLGVQGHAILPVVVSAEGMHLTMSDGVFVDAWVRPEELEPNPRRLAKRYGCNLGAHKTLADSALVRPAVARVPTKIRVGTTSLGPPVGDLRAGGEVIVLEVRDGFARVLPRCLELVPPWSKSFFVLAKDLAIGAEEPWHPEQCPRR